MTTSYKDFKSSDLTFTEWADSEKMKIKGQQKMCFPRYGQEESNLFLQLPWMKISRYGVPSLGEYYSTDKDRAFLKMPLDTSDPEVKLFYDKFAEFDANMNSAEVKTKLFGKKAKKYKYIPVVKIPDEVDDEHPPWMKLKIHLDWQDDSVLTEVWHSEPSTEEGKKRTRTKVDVSTVQEFQDNVSYLSDVRLIVKPTKLWAQSEKLPEPTFGVSWRIFKVEVEPRKVANSLNQFKGNDAFLDSDSSDDEADENLNADGNDNDANEDEESESDEDSDDSEDESPPSPVLKKKATKSKSKN